MGDLVQLTLAIEIMGRHSNIILIDEDGRVIDSIKRIDDTMSSVRPILPGVHYTLPPAQDKLNLIESTPEQIEQRLRSGKDTPLSKARSPPTRASPPSSAARSPTTSLTATTALSPR